MKSRIPLTKKIRERVKAKCGGHCGYCGIKPDRLQIDHMTPVEYGGTNDESNLMPACPQCNNYKYTHGVEAFREVLMTQVHKARKYSINFRNAERFGLIQILDVKRIEFFFEKTRS
jgi:5-methylcytosine-specific restriction endonuclease McrA